MRRAASQYASGETVRGDVEFVLTVNYAAYLWSCWEKSMIDPRWLTWYEHDLILAFDQGVTDRQRKNAASSVGGPEPGSNVRRVETRVEDFLKPKLK